MAIITANATQSAIRERPVVATVLEWLRDRHTRVLPIHKRRQSHAES
jgi:hypothetical protein